MTDAQTIYPVDVDAFIAQMQAERRVMDQEYAQYREEQHKLFLAKAERMWGGERVVDPNLPRFDHIDSIQLSITPDQWECDDWLKVR